MCTCNTEIFRYTNLTTELVFEKCGRTKETLTDTPKNKSCAGVWFPSKKTPCGMMRVFDKDRNLLFEGKDTDYFQPKKVSEKNIEKTTYDTEIIETKEEHVSPITKKWIERYYVLKNSEKLSEYNTYIHPIEGYSDMTPREKMIARLKLPKPKYKKRENSLMDRLWEEMKEEGEYNKYCCIVLCGIFSKHSLKNEIKKVPIISEKENLPIFHLESDDDDDEEEIEEEWSEEEEEEEETDLEENFGTFSLVDTTAIDF